MESILKTNNIVKKYGQKTVLNKVSININKGDIYGFIGKNGAGKTTLMRVILQLTNKDSGDIYYYNNKPFKEVGLKIGSLVEKPGLYRNTTAYENLKRFSILYNADESKINDILNLVGLSNTKKKKVKNFSLGMKQRLAIAIALLGEPELLILDEPINGLDPEGIKEIRDIIIKLNKEKNITFLISSHLLDELSKIATKYGIIDNGCLIKEIDAKQLKKKAQNKFIIETDTTKKAFNILIKTLPKENIKIKENKLEITITNIKPPQIIKLLIEENINIYASYQDSENLEDYFITLVGEDNG